MEVTCNCKYRATDRDDQHICECSGHNVARDSMDVFQYLEHQSKDCGELDGAVTKRSKLCSWKKKRKEISVDDDDHLDDSICKGRSCGQVQILKM